MTDFVRVGMAGRGASGVSCQARAVTLAGWPVMVAAWARKGRDARALLEGALSFWNSAALLSDRREDLRAALRGCVNFALRQTPEASPGEVMLAAAVFAPEAVCWARAGVGNLWRYAVGEGWRRLTCGGAAWIEGGVSPTELDCLLMLPPGGGRVLKQQRQRLLKALLRTRAELTESPWTSGPAICAAIIRRPAKASAPPQGPRQSPEPPEARRVRPARGSPPAEPEGGEARRGGGWRSALPRWIRNRLDGRGGPPER